MKTKLATTLAIITSMTLPLSGADDPNSHTNDSLFQAASPVPSTTQLEIKIMQIELDVALKQFEKIATTLAAAALESRLVEWADGESDEQIRKRLLKAEDKMRFLMGMKERLRKEIMDKGAEIEEQRKKWGISADSAVKVPRALPTPQGTAPILNEPVPAERATNGVPNRN